MHQCVAPKYMFYGNLAKKICVLNSRAKGLHKTVYLCVVLYKNMFSAHFWGVGCILNRRGGS